MFAPFFNPTATGQAQEQAAAPDTVAAEVDPQERVEQASGIGFWDFDTQSGLVRWSFGMEAIYGLAKGGFKGTAEDFICRIHPDDVSRNLRESQAALDRKGMFDIEFRILRPDGSVRWVRSRGTARFGADGAHLGASGFQIDITEQVQRDQQMRLQSQVLTTIAEGVMLIDAQSATILYSNPRMEALLGYAPGGLLGQPISSINARQTLDPVATAQAIQAHLRQHGHWRGEVLNRCADGSEIWTSATVNEVHYDGVGKVWVSVHTDINAQHLAQAARQEALEQLQRLSLNFQDSVEAERLALSREVHDQLGASLTGMRMQLEALADRLRPLAPALAQEAMALCVQASQTQRAARDICARLRPPLLDDMGLVEACRWYCKEWRQHGGMRISTRLQAVQPEPDGALATDMFRVLQELLTNVTRHARATQVHVSLRARAGVLTLRVQDDGCGFDPAARASGFGLMGIRERVRHHEGMLQIRSDTRGTEVTASMQLRTTP